MKSNELRKKERRRAKVSVNNGQYIGLDQKIKMSVKTMASFASTEAAWTNNLQKIWSQFAPPVHLCISKNNIEQHRWRRLYFNSFHQFYSYFTTTHHHKLKHSDFIFYWKILFLAKLSSSWQLKLQLSFIIINPTIKVFYQQPSKSIYTTSKN